MKVSSLVGLFLVAVVCLSVASNLRSEVGEEGDAFALVRELGSDSFRARQAAAAGLLEIGWKAREAVMSALDSDDPEVRFLAADIWRRVRWKVYPEISEETEGLMDQILETEDNAAELWKKVVAINGERAFGLMMGILEVSDAKLASARTGVEILLSQSEIGELSETITKLPEPFTREKVREFVGRIRRSPSHTDAEQLKMMRLCLELGMYGATLKYGAAAWCARRNGETLDAVVEAVKKGELEDKIWEMAEAYLKREVDGDHPWEICFYVALARRFENQKVVPALLESRAIPAEDPKVLAFLHGELSEMKLGHLMTGDLMRSEDADLLYLAHLSLKSEGRLDEAEAAWEKALRSLKEESECYTLGESMGKRGDPRREEVWKRILEMGPENSVYDANARFRLATIYEAQGKFGEAADMQELGLRHMVGALLMTTPDGRSISGPEAKNLILADIERLREKAGE